MSEGVNDVKDKHCSKINVISQTQFDIQRGNMSGANMGGEDDLQFDLDDNDKQPLITMATQPETPPLTPPTSDLSPIREKDEDSISTISHPWLEQRARFYPAPILPNKLNKVMTTPT